MRVRCRCSHEYDTMDVVVKHRYADCSVWDCPKCGVQGDDRQYVIQPYTEVLAHPVVLSNGCVTAVRY